MSQYNDPPRHYRLVNFFGLALSTGTLLLIVPQLAPDTCALCSLAQFALIAISSLFLLAWLQNPQQAGQRTYATLNLLLTTPILASLILSAWLQHKGQLSSCTSLLNTSMDNLTPYLPANINLVQATSGNQLCHISNIAISGVDLAYILIAAFTLLTVNCYQLDAAQSKSPGTLTFSLDVRLFSTYQAQKNLPMEVFCA